MIVLRVLNAALKTVLIVVVVTNLALSAASLSGQVRVSRELTGSMLPVIPVGSLILYRPETASLMRVGQIIRYNRNDYPDPVTHRVVAVRRQGNYVSFRTKGDANNAKDGGTYLLAAGVTVWQTTSVLPSSVGGVVQAVTDHGLTLTLGFVPLALLLPWLRRRLIASRSPVEPPAPAPRPQADERPSIGSP